MFWNGSTAIDGLSGSARAGSVRPAKAWCRSSVPSRTRYTRTGRAMFLRLCSPRSSNANVESVADWSRTVADTQIPPGSGDPF